MRLFLILLISTFLPLAVGAQGPKEHNANDETNQLPVTTGTQKYDLEKSNNSLPSFSTQPVHDKPIYAFLFFDRFEQRLQKGKDVLLWDANASIGNDYHKILIESEGEMVTKDTIYEESRNEVLYAYAITAFWDVTLGYRRDIVKDKDDRGFAAIGLQGMAPFLFEVDASSYISDEGNLSAIAEIEYSFQLTQRTQFIPRIEMDLSFQDVDQPNTETGMTRLGFGGRLTYEFVREFAPYIGGSWENLVFETANIAEAQGEETSHFAVVLGMRLAL